MPPNDDVKVESKQDTAASSGAHQALSDITAQVGPDKDAPAGSNASENATGNEAKNNASQPLAPPPRPSQQNVQGGGGGGDYFSANHGTNNSHFSLEPNPFEQSFGNPSTETPGKFGGLPSVASLTSPAPLGPGGTPSLQDSLRSGPLSPAMLPGPTNNQPGYFDESFRNSFPTPNESSLRTGLTPGGGGSIFPAPSPNSQAIFNLQGGGATPGTLEFQRTALNAAVRNKVESHGQSTNQNPQSAIKHEYQPAQQAQQLSNQPENDAVNSLYMLANHGNKNANQFALLNQHQQQQPGMNVAQAQQRMGGDPQDPSPTAQRGYAQPGRGARSSAGNGSEFDEDGEDSRPATRARGKRGAAGKAPQPATGKKRAGGTSPKGPAKKRSKSSGGLPQDMEPEDDDDDDMSIRDEGDGPTHHKNGKKMTDDEKRKNFLERNRVAALKCRQRKKQWLLNLQTKVEIFTSENDALTAQCSSLREEIINLKTLLLAHKDCPVSQRQGLSGNAMLSFMGETDTNNPYNMAVTNGGQMMGMQPNHGGMQRR